MENRISRVKREMPEVVDKVEANLKAHVDTTRDTLHKEVTTIKAAAKDFKELKPVQGIVNLIAGSIDNAGEGLRKQAEITRRWV